MSRFETLPALRRGSRRTMAKMRQDPRGWRKLFLAQLAFAPAACGPEYEVLTSPAAPAPAGAAGVGRAGAGSGAGQGGNAGTGGLPEGGESGDSQATGGGPEESGGSQGVAGGAGKISCARHLDCPEFQTCHGGLCTPCSTSALDCSQPCPAEQRRVAVIRNGCAICECAPASECRSDSECEAGEVCYRGAQCEEGCESLDCCYGNRCGISGCSGPPPSCSVSGCEGGAVCEPSCMEASCSCDGMNWSCTERSRGAGGSGGTGAIGGNECPSLCVPP
jgi:hypothetical protein